MHPARVKVGPKSVPRRCHGDEGGPFAAVAPALRCGVRLCQRLWRPIAGTRKLWRSSRSCRPHAEAGGGTMLKINSLQTSRRPVILGYLVAIASVVAAMIGL